MFMLPTLKLNIERWKYNPNFELWVSNMGRIRNKDRKDIKPRVLQSGYMAVKVHGSINHYMLLHRIVMITWKPIKEIENFTVDHLDHNKRNNSLSNLEWVSREENYRRAKEDYLSNVSSKDDEVILCRKKNIKNKQIIGLFVSSEVHELKPSFVSFDNPNKIHEVLNTYYGRVNNLSKKKVNIIKNALLDGSNTSGIKKYCGFTFEAKYNIIEEIDKT